MNKDTIHWINWIDKRIDEIQEAINMINIHQINTGLDSLYKLRKELRKVRGNFINSLSKE